MSNNRQVSSALTDGRSLHPENILRGKQMTTFQNAEMFFAAPGIKARQL
jgi:hypothetical protein